MSGFVTRDEYLSNGEPLRVLTVNAYGKSYRLRAWSADELERFEVETYKLREAGQPVNVAARAITHSLVDDGGRQMFLQEDGTIDPRAVEATRRRDARWIRTMWKPVAQLQGFGEDDAEEDGEGN